MPHAFANSPAAFHSKSPSNCFIAKKIGRRAFLGGASCLALMGCGDGSGNAPSITPPTPAPSPTPTPAVPQPPPGAVLVSTFYRADHGINLQPAVQAAIDHAATQGLSNVFYDLASPLVEMWCPARSTTGKYTADGIPLVVRHPLNLDFNGVTIVLKGPGGGDRKQNVKGMDEIWLGGWLYIIGGPSFDHFSLRNVTVEGGYFTDVRVNENRVLNDKGVRIHDTDVASTALYNVELRNFGGEIYYIGGLNLGSQELENCHFHGSPQSAFNPAGIGTLKAKNLRAGKAHIACEAICGKSHRYTDCEFYDSVKAGWIGGPSPTLRQGYPWTYPYWDGSGTKPEIFFGDGVVIRNVEGTLLTCWVTGHIEFVDSTLVPYWECGDLNDWKLTSNFVADRKSNYPAVLLGGPPEVNMQVPGAPEGVYCQPPHNISIEMTCKRTTAALASGNKIAAALHLTGGLIDSNSVNFSISGEAEKVSAFVGPASPGFQMPRITLNGFVEG